MQAPAWPGHFGLEDMVTFGGFCALIVAVLVLGFHDQVHVRNMLNAELEKLNAEVPSLNIARLSRPRETLKDEWSALRSALRRNPRNQQTDEGAHDGNELGRT